jgi:hypothetical protein
MHRLCAVPKYISVLWRTDEAPSPLSSPHPGVRPPSVESNFTHQSLRGTESLSSAAAWTWCRPGKPAHSFLPPLNA